MSNIGIDYPLLWGSRTVMLTELTNVCRKCRSSADFVVRCWCSLERSGWTYARENRWSGKGAESSTARQAVVGSLHPVRVRWPAENFIGFYTGTTGTCPIASCMDYTKEWRRLSWDLEQHRTMKSQLVRSCNEPSDSELPCPQKKWHEQNLMANFITHYSVLITGISQNLLQLKNGMENDQKLFPLLQMRV